jgi:predicted GNAT family N-acyltransferase
VIVELFDITDTDRLKAAFAIRMRVFVVEQGVPPEEEIDDHDRSDRQAVHALALREPRDLTSALGAGRFYVSEHDADTVQIGRMAVDAAARGTGVGAAILAALVAEARRRGFTKAHLHAQTHASEFYRKAGFYDDGATLMDAGILHQPMSLMLAKNAR